MLSFFIILFIVSMQPACVLAQSNTHQETADIITGSDYLKEGSYEEAVEEFKKARAEDPASAVAAYYLGIACKKMQDYSNAKTNLKDAVTLRPAVKEAVVELADVQYQLGEINDALDTLETAEQSGIWSAQSAFIKGLVLSRLGRGKDAIGSFKAAKEMDKSFAQSSDYQIALINLQTGELTEAKAIFKEIIIRDPNSDLAQFAKQYIDAITKRIKEERQFRLAVDLQYQHDNNVLLKPGDASVAADITGEADASGTASLRAEYVPKLKMPLSFKTQYSFYINDHYDLKRYDVQSHTLAIVPGYNFSYGQISLLTNYNYTLVDDDRYLRTYLLSPTYSFALNKNQFMQVTLKYQGKQYRNPPINSNENRNGKDYAGGISWFYLFFEGKGFFNIRYDLNKEDTSGQNWRYSGNKIGTGLLYPITKKLTLNINGEAYLQNFEHTHTVFNEKREDATYTGVSMLSYKIFENTDIELQYVYVRGVSNISVYDYDKTIISGGIALKL